MLPANYIGLEEAFAEWLDQGPSAPTNRDIVVHDKVDIELLEHLASFIWYKAKENKHEI